jgi:hypothetical protein
MQEYPNYLLILDKREEWQWNEHITGMGKEYVRKDGWRLRYEMDISIEEWRQGSCLNLKMRGEEERRKEENDDRIEKKWKGNTE